MAHDDPAHIELNDIRTSSLGVFARSFLDEVRSSPVSKGWTGSLRLDPGDISLPYSEDVCASQWRFRGLVNMVNEKSEAISITDKTCQLSCRSCEPIQVKRGDKVSAILSSVYVSSLCLSTPCHKGILDTSDCLSSIQIQSLPHLANPIFNNVFGGAALVLIGNYVLVSCVQVRCTSFTVSARNTWSGSSQQKQRECISKKSFTIEESLGKPKQQINPATKVVGILTRSIFRHVQVNSSGHSTCLSLFLSSKPCNYDQERNLSCMQSIKLSVSIPHTAIKVTAFKRALDQLVSDEMQTAEDEYALGAYWWSVADSCRATPILCGGWDEYVGTCAESTVIQVDVPIQSMHFAERGYIRWACKLNTVEASFIHAEDRPTNEETAERKRLDFVGAGKFYDGMLNRRPRRRNPFGRNSRRIVGERVSASSDGVSKYTLSELCSLACISMCNKDPSVLSPSLVRRLTRTHCLGIIYCEVHCKCRRCFSKLVNMSSLKKSNDDSDDDEPSFWHLPLLGSQSLCGPVTSTESITNHSMPLHVVTSNLRCPNECPIEDCEVQWECSGVLDDGTGQAKFYAEREAALTLLGMAKEQIEEIEKGIWSTDFGMIQYLKSVPPSSRLRAQLQKIEARIRPRNLGAIQPRIGKGERHGVLSSLKPAVRAEYLLHHHCRSSGRPRRKLDYFVRCKPLLDRVCRLNHTTVRVFSSPLDTGRQDQKDISSYTSPTLKLDLVDCCIPP